MQAIEELLQDPDGLLEEGLSCSSSDAFHFGVLGAILNGDGTSFEDVETVLKLLFYG